MQQTLVAPATRTSALQRFLTSAIILIAGGVFAWHAFAITAFNLPLNPLTPTLRPIVDPYVLPFFSQGWNFFAPDPIDSDNEAFFRYRYRDQSGKLHTTSWIELTGTLDRTIDYNRFSPYWMISEVVRTPLDEFANDKFALEKKRHGPDWERLAQTRYQPFHLHAIERAGMSLAHAVIPANSPYWIQFAANNTQFPRFTHRNEPRAKPNPSFTVTFPWVSSEFVAPFMREI